MVVIWVGCGRFLFCFVPPSSPSDWFVGLWCSHWLGGLDRTGRDCRDLLAAIVVSVCGYD